jgi:hypothetical protein
MLVYRSQGWKLTIPSRAENVHVVVGVVVFVVFAAASVIEHSPSFLGTTFRSVPGCDNDNIFPINCICRHECLNSLNPLHRPGTIKVIPTLPLIACRDKCTFIFYLFQKSV